MNVIETSGRALVVPALMVLMGRVNWWMPGWLSSLVHRVGLCEAPTASAHAQRAETVA